MTSNFIEENYLKKNEVIEKIQEDHAILDVLVFKRTAKTYKKVAQFKIAKMASHLTSIPKRLAAYKFTANAKRKIEEPNEVIQQWLIDGFIVRELRYHVDGLSVMTDLYRIGPTYKRILDAQRQQSKEREIEWLQQIERQKSELQLPAAFEQLMQMEKLPAAWKRSKRKKFLEFCLAFYTLSTKKDLFDYKEIGAIWLDEIGGSKYFDVERKDYVEFLEKSNIDPAYYGLVSIGKITPIFFTGKIDSEYAQYKIGVVHATTDNAVLNSTYKTENTTLWLVENRAILTRMAIEKEFLEQTNSCVICLDGQIRSAHKRLIEQLQHSELKQTIIWTDTDAAGKSISKNAAALIKGPIKIIGRHFEVFHSVAQYEASEVAAHEQEQQLGGVEQWSQWI